MHIPLFSVVANSRRQFGPVLDLIVSLNNSYETMPGVKYLSNFKGNSPVISLTGKRLVYLSLLVWRQFFRHFTNKNVFSLFVIVALFLSSRN